MKEAKYRIAMTENPELIANIAPESVLGALYKATRRGPIGIRTVGRQVWRFLSSRHPVAIATE